VASAEKTPREVPLFSERCRSRSWAAFSNSNFFGRLRAFCVFELPHAFPRVAVRFDIGRPRRRGWRRPRGSGHVVRFDDSREFHVHDLMIDIVRGCLFSCCRRLASRGGGSFVNGFDSSSRSGGPRRESALSFDVTGRSVLVWSEKSCFARILFIRIAKWPQRHFRQDPTFAQQIDSDEHVNSPRRKSRRILMRSQCSLPNVVAATDPNFGKILRTNPQTCASSA